MNKPQVQKIISAKTGLEWWAMIREGRPYIHLTWRGAVDASLNGHLYSYSLAPYWGEFTRVSEVSK